MGPSTKHLVAPLLVVLLGLLTGCGLEEDPAVGEAARPGESSAVVPPSSASATATEPTSAPTARPSGTASRTPGREPSRPDITMPSLPTPKDRGLVEGADASWPQCPKGMGIPEKPTLGAPMPFDSAEFVVLGLTNGPGFYPNPCLQQQGSWVKEQHTMLGVYAVVSYPEARHLQQYAGEGPFDAATETGRLSNVGYQQALFNLRTMADAGLQAPAIWVDVEPVGDFEWSTDLAANAAVVEGAVRAYQDRGYTVGVYSTRHLWATVVGDLQLGLPEWRAAGQTSRAEALRRCGGDAMFQGGAAVMAQWVEADRDRNVTCPGESTYLELWFRQY